MGLNKRGSPLTHRHGQVIPGDGLSFPKNTRSYWHTPVGITSSGCPSPGLSTALNSPNCYLKLCLGEMKAGIGKPCTALSP